MLLIPASASSATLDRAQVEQFARARAADTYELLMGPSTRQPQLEPVNDCRALYQQRMALQRNLHNGKASFYDEPRHAGAVFIGTVWTPAFYYLPFRAVAALASAGQAEQRLADLDHLRRAAAQQRCFER